MRLRTLAPDGPVVAGRAAGGRGRSPRAPVPATAGRVISVGRASDAASTSASASTASGAGVRPIAADRFSTPVGPDDAVTNFLVAYDIEREAVRRRVAETCQDYGLVRIQWSVFMGPLRSRYHAEVMEALARRIAGQAGTIDCFMICAADVSRRRRLDGATVPAPARTVRGRPRPSRPTARRAVP